MKQIGQPINSVEQGLKLFLCFGSTTVCFSYFVYSHPNVSDLIKLASAYGIMLTGQVAYNTAVLGLLGNNHDTSIQDA